jgi:predicted TPR repeat methyltransferase
VGKDVSQKLSSVSHLGIGDSSQNIYDEWSEDYDSDLLGELGYISPDVAARALAAELVQRDIEIIDYGCGTGLVGEALSRQGFKIIDGLDISEGMLAQAVGKQVYRHLSHGDLTAKTSLDDASYDAALCIGSMGAGHVGAEHVPELLRAIKPGGLFIIIINSQYYESEGFDEAVKQMQDDGLWLIRKLEAFNYMDAVDRPGLLLITERL